jgi:26S proteasome regulatory subunit N9
LRSISINYGLFALFFIFISADWNITSLLSRIDTKTSKEARAHVLLLGSIAHAKLLYGDLEGTKSDMDVAWRILDALEGVDNSVKCSGIGFYY